ncbi:MAG TPA: thrombospondin type 3 repeat-containing protein, partial [Planctomycetota bacterium]|nr:thrombospondin type 3 repeat-containing protein [Planctomycetota bacterium]
MRPKTTLAAASLLLALLVPCLAPRTLHAGFIRGDVDGSGGLEVSDAIRIFGHLFLGAPSVLSCADAADVSDRGQVDLSSGIYLLGYLFLGGPPPAAPFPECGEDLTPDALGCDEPKGCPDVGSESDLDSDGVPNEKDNCPLTPNLGQEDQDRDGVGDACDNCPAVPNPGQELGACWSLSLDEQFTAVSKLVPEFAGFYYVGDSLRVALTDPSDEVLEQANAAIAKVFGPRVDRSRIEAVPAKYDFKTLHEIREVARSLFDVEGVTYLDTDETTNRVVIGVESVELIPAVRKLLERSRTDLDAIVFEERRPIATRLDLRAEYRPLKSGVQIASGGSCTLGFVARREGVLGFVTNSHCTNGVGPNGTDFYQPSSPRHVGVESFDPFVDSTRSSDSAFVTLDPDIEAVRGTI